MNTVSGSTFQVEEDPTPTQQIWQPVSDLDKEQQQAFRDMLDAMNHGDLDAAGKAKQRIEEIEVEQVQAHAAARAYLVAKAEGRVRG